jgi:hypothetical protein
MADLAGVTGVGELLSARGIALPSDDFEAAYQRLVVDPRLAEVAAGVQEQLRSYFSQLVLPDHVTIYDELLLSLRPKDLVATFNWDPLLAQAFKRNRDLAQLPRILFLHGGVDVGACNEHKQKGFLEHSCTVCGERLSPQPLLYPIEDKNYELDPLIANEWQEFRNALEEAYLVTVFGYAAPTSDVAARKAMLDMWKKNPHRELGEIEIIDVKSRQEVEHNWRDFTVRSHFGVTASLRQSLVLLSPRRTCDHFAMATLQQRPCRRAPLPAFTALRDLQDFVRQLIREEEDLASGSPLPC